jgi:hypothetical protein
VARNEGKLLMALDCGAGEPGRNRTFNPQIKSLLLCQLSYWPTRGVDAHRGHRVRIGKS